MKERKSIFRKNFILIFVFFIWVFVSVGISLFIDQIFTSNQREFLNRERTIIVFFIILSIVLSIIIVTYFIIVTYNFLRNKFGSKLQLKITIIFVFLIILPILPFTLIGIKFFRSSVNLWYSKEVGSTLDSSQLIIKEYYNEKKEKLFSLSKDYYEKLTDNGTKDLNMSILFNADNVYTDGEIKFSRANISIWSRNGELIGQYGEEIFDLESNLSDKSYYNEVEKLDYSIDYRQIFRFKKNGNLYVILPTSLTNKETGQLVAHMNFALPIHKNFDTIIEDIDETIVNYNTIFYYKDFFINGFIIFFFASIFPIVLITLTISLFMARDFLRPIIGLLDATNRISEGDYDFKVNYNSFDEFESLVDSFNSMISELNLSKMKLKQKEKIATWQEIAKRLAHEIRNPLTPIRLSAERIQAKYNKPDFDKVLEKGVSMIINQVETMDKMLVQFSYFAKLPGIHCTRGSIKYLLIDVISIFDSNEYNIEIALNFDREDYIISRDEILFKSIFINLIKNSIESMQKKGEIIVDVYSSVKGVRELVIIQIKDQGCGISITNEDVLFTPYFSNKKNGVGLGLSIAQRIVSEHNGHIYYKSEEGGTSFFVEFPILE